jgi:Flp pilus assembly protein TadG
MHRARNPGDRGSVSLWVVIFAFVALSLLILVVDGGQAMIAKSRAADIAEQAARAAADDVNLPALRAGTVAINAAACAVGGPADTLVRTYSKGIGVTATMTDPNGGPPCQIVTANGVPAVQVWVQVQMNPAFPFPPFTSINATASDTAYLACGSATARTAC